jgi:tetratricopeptide (TPR) repeat protein
MNPFFSIIKWAYGESGLAGLPKEMAPNIILRDVVQRILMMDPQKKPRILCAPTSSTQVALYSGAEVLGTLYWENKDGLKAAAKIFASTTEEETKQLLIQKGITHILLFSWDEFIVEYAELLNTASGKPSENNDLFIKKLITEESPPQWLRPLYYPIPESFDMKDQKVFLYQVVPDQTAAEYHLNLGLYHYDAKNYDKAIEEFRKSGLENPSNPQIPKLIDFCEKEKSNT